MKDRLGVKVRSIELNVNQRCSSAMLSATDEKEAIASGSFGVQTALKGTTGMMIAFHRTDDADYHITYDMEKFVVEYIPNGSNLLPSISVLPLKAKKGGLP